MRKDAGPAAAGAVKIQAVANAATKTDGKTKPVPVIGRVVDPDGRPVAGAKLYLTEPYDYFRQPQPPAAVRATTGKDGRFEFKATVLELSAPESPRRAPHRCSSRSPTGSVPGLVSSKIRRRDTRSGWPVTTYRSRAASSTPKDGR